MWKSQINLQIFIPIFINISTNNYEYDFFNSQ